MKHPLHPARSMTRFLIAILILTALPFLVLHLNERLSPSRNVASDLNQEVGLSTQLDSKAIKYKILATAQKVLSAKGAQIHLGLPLLIDDNGRDVFMCEEFPTVDWILTADGVATSGELPQIIVRAPCVVQAQTKQILGPALNWKDILKLNPLGQNSLEADWQEAAGGKVQIFIRNGADFWPQDWTWTGVRFYGKESQKSLAIDVYEIISVLGSPVVLSTSE